VELAQATDVIDMRVRADDGFDNQAMAANQVQDARDFVARVHHERFARGRIADDRAIALQHPHRNGDVNQSVRGSIEGGPSVAHAGDYIIETKGFTDGTALRVAVFARLDFGGRANAWKWLRQLQL
jgi:hypothetical protein